MAQGIAQNWRVWIGKMILGVFVLSVTFYYGVDKNVTISQFVQAFASIPATVVAFVEVMDKFADKRDIYNKFTEFMTPYTKSHTPIISALILGGLTFFAVLFMVTSTMTLNLQSYAPGVLFAAAIVAVYVILPETGNAELIAYIWLAATIVTKGQYLTILPGMAIAKLALWLLK